MWMRPTWPRRATAITMVFLGCCAVAGAALFKLWPILDDEKRVVLIGMLMVGTFAGTTWAIRSDFW